MTIGGLRFPAIAWASGGELLVRNPVIYLAVFTAIVWFTLSFTMVGRRLYASAAIPKRLASLASTSRATS